MPRGAEAAGAPCRPGAEQGQRLSWALSRRPSEDLKLKSAVLRQHLRALGLYLEAGPEGTANGSLLPVNPLRQSRGSVGQGEACCCGRHRPEFVSSDPAGELGSPTAPCLSVPEREMKGLDWTTSVGLSHSEGREVFISFHVKPPVPAAEPLGVTETRQRNSRGGVFSW